MLLLMPLQCNFILQYVLVSFKDYNFIFYLKMFKLDG